MTQNSLPVQERLSSIIKASLPIILKKHGFRKQSNSYVYQAEKLSYVIKVYKSRYNTEDQLDFRLEWGINVNEELKKEDIPFKAEALYGTHGDLTKEKRNPWFTLRSTDVFLSDETLQHEIIYVIEKEIIPFLFSFRTIEDIIQILEDTPFTQALWSVPDPGPQTYRWLSILYYFIDKAEKSCEILDKAIQEAKIESFKNNLLTLKQQIMKNITN